MTHPLDRPVWTALTGRQAALAVGDDRAFRLHPDYGVFAAVREKGLEPLLPALGNDLWLVDTDAFDPPAGMAATYRPIAQMVAERIAEGEAGFEIVALTDDDAPEMLALATLTQPGPFARHTNRLGGFIGVKNGGRLVAMAGERLQPPGFTEVSGVCTLPGHRGRGYARGLMREVARRILARGDRAFLHVYPENSGAIALYEALGFRHRATVTLTRFVSA